MFGALSFLSVTAGAAVAYLADHFPRKPKCWKRAPVSC